MQLETILVPTDFSESSERALEAAKDLVSGEDACLIILHVVDHAFIEECVANDLGQREPLLDRIWSKAMERLETLREQALEGVHRPLRIERLSTHGIPFLEIIRKAEEFEVDAVVMSRYGLRGKVEKALFGTTAEKVARWSTKPVLVFPGLERAAVLPVPA